MKISLNWLREYTQLTMTTEELAERLTMAGLEVESVDDQAKKYSNFVVGKVREVAKHPQADKLSICKVDVGHQTLQIVCGAPNVASGQSVPVGLAGAEVPRNQHDPEGKPFKLSNVKIRGVESYGMICSAYELGLGDDKDGILILEGNAEPGLKLSTYYGLDDVVLEIGITPNRPDAMSHIGIAREVAAFSEKTVKFPKPKLKESNRNISKFVSVKVENQENCPRYSARALMGVKVGVSPKWIKDRLTSIGVRPVNSIVDITNYVLMEYGHPLHAFDYDLIKDQSVVVKLAGGGESFITLDHKRRSLRSDTLMICDAYGYVAIAGIMGGENSEISDATVNIILESAYFNPRSIRKSAKHFGLSTDASQRFERGADPNITLRSLDRAASLIQEICGGEILRGVIDIYPKKIAPKTLSLRIDKVNAVLGTSLNRTEVVSCLKKIDFDSVRTPQKKNTTGILKFKIPTFRPDIEREVDLIEEVARTYGYENISSNARTSLSLFENAPQTDFKETISDVLIGNGFHEIVSNSMQDETVVSVYSDKYVKIANPISKEMSAIRTSLLPGMLQVIRNNLFHGNKNIRLYEIGNIYYRDPQSVKKETIDSYIEETHLAFALSGSRVPQNWSKKQHSVDIYDLKGELETLCQKIFLDKFKFIPYSSTKALTQSGLVLQINGVEAGYLGIVSPEVVKMYEIEQDVFVGEIDINILRENVQKGKSYRPVPKYPSVFRDVAFVVDEILPVKDVEDEMRNVGKPLLSMLEVFDVYTGDQIATNKKSCAFALEFQAEDHTLSQEEIDQLMQKIILRVSNKFDALIRM